MTAEPSSVEGTGSPALTHHGRRRGRQRPAQPPPSHSFLGGAGRWRSATGAAGASVPGCAVPAL
eukprot:12973588-Alexandrium_andersonii.AAC.1